jgi:hypothetical protein
MINTTLTLILSGYKDNIFDEKGSTIPKRIPIYLPVLIVSQLRNQMLIKRFNYLTIYYFMRIGDVKMQLVLCRVKIDRKSGRI